MKGFAERPQERMFRPTEATARIVVKGFADGSNREDSREGFRGTVFYLQDEVCTHTGGWGQCARPKPQKFDPRLLIWSL